MSTQQVWVITGSSQGLGRELALVALSRGDNVIATARSIENVQDLLERYPENCRALRLDVTDSFQSLVAKAKQAVALWGTIDVVVNNAAWSLIGNIEEGGSEGLMEMYQTNVFGAVNVTNAFLPYMRQRRSGTIVFIGSRSGWRTGFPTISPYSSSKAAVHAIADSLSVELTPFNIKVLNVVPGGLRTANIDHIRIIPNENLPMPGHHSPVGEVPEYAAIRKNVQQYLDATNGTQTGDAKKAASVIVDVVRNEGVSLGRPWPKELFLGSDCVKDVTARCEETLKRVEEWSDVAIGIDL